MTRMQTPHTYDKGHVPSVGERPRRVDVAVPREEPQARVHAGRPVLRGWGDGVRECGGEMVYGDGDIYAW